MRNLNLFTDGKHFLSGIGYTTIKSDGFYEDDIDVDLFCIDGITYGAFIDPNDGYRSYGAIQEIDAKCQYTFPPQPVLVKNVEINNTIEHNDENYGWSEVENKYFICITDAINKKEVLLVGTDYSEDYYPRAIFRYTPENLEVNKNR